MRDDIARVVGSIVRPRQIRGPPTKWPPGPRTGTEEGNLHAVTRQANSRNVKKHIDRWAPEVVKCRSWQHTWDDDDVIQSPRIWTVVMRCTRCGALRWRDVNA